VSLLTFFFFFLPFYLPPSTTILASLYSLYQIRLVECSLTTLFFMLMMPCEGVLETIPFMDYVDLLLFDVWLNGWQIMHFITWQAWTIMTIVGLFNMKNIHLGKVWLWRSKCIWFLYNIKNWIFQMIVSIPFWTTTFSFALNSMISSS
jgi:hypothetical protein